MEEKGTAIPTGPSIDRTVVQCQQVYYQMQAKIQEAFAGGDTRNTLILLDGVRPYAEWGFGPTSTEVDWVLFNKAAVLTGIGGEALKEAAALSDQLIRRTEYSDRNQRRLSYETLSGMIAALQGGYAEAEQSLRAATDAFLSGEFGAGERARAYGILAAVLLARGEDDASEVFRDEFNENLNELPPSERVAIGIAVGSFFNSLKGHDQAIDVLTQAFEDLRQSRNGCSAHLGKICDELTRAYLALGDCANAKVILFDCWTEAGTTFGRDSVEVARAEINLGLIEARLQNVTLARAHMDRAEAIARADPTNRYYVLAKALQFRAAMFKSADPKYARQLGEEALSVAETAGDEYLLSAVAQFLTSSIYPIFDNHHALIQGLDRRVSAWKLSQT